MKSLDDLLRSLDGDTEGLRDTRLEDAWNILVQVLLPMVLVLTFVIITGVLAYKSALESLNYILQKEGDFAEIELKEQIVEVQLQRLLRALEAVQAKQREEIGLTLFPGPRHVRREDVRIVDGDFQRLCNQAVQILGAGASPAVTDYANELYRQVLQEAGIQDPARVDVRRRNESEGGKIGLLEESETLRATPNVITSTNRRKIHNLILDFLSGLEEEIVELQVGLVNQIFSELLASGDTGELDEDSSRMLREIVDPATSEKVRRTRAEELYRTVLRRWHERLDREGYPFLEKSWRQLRS
jgi:hypothetical protein